MRAGRGEGVFFAIFDMVGVNAIDGVEKLGILSIVNALGPCRR